MQNKYRRTDDFTYTWLLKHLFQISPIRVTVKKKIEWTNPEQNKPTTLQPHNLLIKPFPFGTTPFQVSIKCETPVDPYSFVDEEMTMNGMRTASSPGDAPSHHPDGMTSLTQCGQPPGLGTPAPTPPGMCTPQQQQHPMGMQLLNGSVTQQQQQQQQPPQPQLGLHQPKKRGRKKKCEMILTPEEWVLFAE